jgi:hypothetical protein
MKRIAALFCTCLCITNSFATMPMAPTDASNPASNTTPPNPTATPGSPATATSAPSTPSTPVAAPDYKADINQINEQIRLISSTKDSIKQMLTEVDADIEKAKSILSSARTNSLDLIKKADEKEAKVAESAIQQQLTEVTGLHKKLKETTSKSFQDATAKIEQAIKLINTTIDQLKTKGITFESAEQAAQQKSAAPTASTPAAPKNWAIPTDAKKASAVAQESPTMVHYVLYKIADGISTFARILYGAYSGAKEVIFGKPTQTLPSLPGTSPSTNPAAPAQPVAPLKTQTPGNNPISLATHESMLASIQVDREAMSNSVRTLEAQLLSLGERLASNKVIAQDLQGGLPLITKMQAQAAWRTTAQYYFDQSLDAIAMVCTKTKNSANYAYSHYVVPLFSKIQTDVTKKMAPKNPNNKTTEKTAIPVIPINKA